jgi:hypothetical protein
VVSLIFLCLLLPEFCWNYFLNSSFVIRELLEVNSRTKKDEYLRFWKVFFYSIEGVLRVFHFCSRTCLIFLCISYSMGVWQEVAMNSLDYHSGLPCPTLVRVAGGGLRLSYTLLDTPRRTPMGLSEII